MRSHHHLMQPLGQALTDWHRPKLPAHTIMQGGYCRVEPLNPSVHAADLFAANVADVAGEMWTYLPYGPFANLVDYTYWLNQTCMGQDPLFYAIIDVKTEQALGLASYLRIDPNNGVIEVGHLAYSPQLQRTTAATEAMYLMMALAFDLGYRRYEWKCNALNAPSCRAAIRLGFTFEGIFRQAAIVKGHNRDTAWYSMLDTEWPALKQAFEAWLAPINYDANSQQLVTLSSLTAKYAKT